MVRLINQGQGDDQINERPVEWGFGSLRNRCEKEEIVALAKGIFGRNMYKKCGEVAHPKVDPKFETICPTVPAH